MRMLILPNRQDPGKNSEASNRRFDVDCQNRNYVNHLRTSDIQLVYELRELSVEFGEIVGFKVLCETKRSIDSMSVCPAPISVYPKHYSTFLTQISCTLRRV